MQIPDEAVRAALARRADLLSDRPDPTALSEETLVRLMLEAAADVLAEAWGVKPKRARGPRPAKRVACPRCGAGSGEDCRSANNWPTNPHKARAQAAVKAGLFPLRPVDGGPSGEQ